MTGRTRVVVVGGGVVGCAILWQFARRGIAGLLVEAEPDICEGTSKANSGIVHTGFDAHLGTAEARLLRRARNLWPEVIDQLGVPFLEVGALMLARDSVEADRLEAEIAANAAAMDVQVSLLTRAAVRATAPYLATDVIAALSIPGESVVDPFWLTRAYAEAAVMAGAEVRLNRRVTGLEADDDIVAVRFADGEVIEAEQVVDAAGLRADEVAHLAGDASFEIRPRQGQFLVAEETFGVDRIVLPIPGPIGKGMLVTPIVFGGLLLGPTAVDGSDKGDTTTDPETRQRILSACRAMVPGIEPGAVIRQFAGLRHVSSSGDFIIRPSEVSDRLYIVAGIRSTGISTSAAIGEAVVGDVLARRGWEAAPNPTRLSPPPVDFADEAGAVACLCRSISDAEVEAAAHRPVAPTTLEGIKRRCGATFGDCQGNLCAIDVAQILAAARNIPVATIEQHRAGSRLWFEGEDAGMPARVKPPGPSGSDLLNTAPGRIWDVVVIGGGSAGRAVARGVGQRFNRLIVERTGDRAALDAAMLDGTVVANGITVAGLDRDGPYWRVVCQSSGGAAEISASMVVIATGAYDMPAEHRGLKGPRPAGLMTGDRARRILGAGFLPGMRVALVGNGVAADHLAELLTARGSRVVRLDDVPEALRGFARLEAVSLRGQWVEADTLVLTDRLLPQTLLIRGLGLVDAVPGRPAPVDAEGRLPLDGMWAVGCCVDPDPGHVACETNGATLGRLIAERMAIGAVTSREAAG